MSEIVDLIGDDMEQQGSIAFNLVDEQLTNLEVKEYTVFYKIVGESRMKLFRNARNELVFVRLNDDWMRQAKVSLAGAGLPLALTLKWDNASVDQLSVQAAGQQAEITATAVQIDN